jgi:hypothetical protein
MRAGTMLRRAFDKTVRRKTLAFAALWDLNRLSPVIDRIHGSCQNETKTNKIIQDAALRHDSRSVARVASAAPAASFKRDYRNVAPSRTDEHTLCSAMHY